MINKIFIIVKMYEIVVTFSHLLNNLNKINNKIMDDISIFYKTIFTITNYFLDISFFTRYNIIFYVLIELFMYVIIKCLAGKINRS